MPVSVPYLACLGFLALNAIWSSGAHAQTKVSIRLEVPSLSLAMLAVASDHLSHRAPAAARLRIVASQNFRTPIAEATTPINGGRMFAINLLGSFGAGLTAAGAFHLVRAEPRASGCHRSEDEGPREEEMRRTGWAVIGVGSTLVVGAIAHWTVVHLQRRAPPMARGERVAVGLAPVGVAAVSSAFLWVGTIFRSLDCFNG